MVGRPRQFDEAEVLDAAIQAFWAKGYEATSMADLLEVTGLHKGSLYQAFGDKHTLFVAALRRYLEGMRSRKNVLLRETESPLEGIRAVAHALVDLASEDEPIRKGCLAMNTLIELAPHDPEVAEVMHSHLSEMRRSLTTQVAAAQEAGEVDAGKDPGAVALMIMTFMAGLATTLKGPMDEATAHRLLDAQIEAIR
jgi:TetR/AcrR family transcriptional repressor of nem operon